MHEKVRALEERRRKDDLPEFAIGDTVRVHVRIREGEKERTQAFALLPQEADRQGRQDQA